MGDVWSLLTEHSHAHAGHGRLSDPVGCSADVVTLSPPVHAGEVEREARAEWEARLAPADPRVGLALG